MQKHRLVRLYLGQKKYTARCVLSDEQINFIYPVIRPVISDFMCFVVLIISQTQGQNGATELANFGCGGGHICIYLCVI